MLLDLVFLLAGAGLLYLGGEGLVTGSASLARSLGLQPIVIGLTVVAFGTSAPELAATLTASLGGSPEIAFGNVVGSNLANVGLILGIAALIQPLRCTGLFLIREMPFMIGTSGLLALLVYNDVVSRLEGLVLLLLLVPYLVVLLRTGGESPEVQAEFEEAYGDGERRLGVDLAKVVVGIGGLVLGAQLLVDGSVGIARVIGIPERVIGLSLVALGTSLPELASALVAAARREGDIVLGNVVGSNVFNVLAILGTTALVRPLPVAAGDVQGDLIVMLALSILVWPLLYTRMHLDRWEGGLLFLLYGSYFAWIFIV